MTGRTLAHYVVEEKLGAGGMGVVYKARDTRLERAVALKVVGEEASEQSRDRLLREARTASALNHPNICTIYEAAAADGETYIAMELVEGRPLSERIGAGLAVETVIRYAAQIADALDHAHERGVVHRDLKSQNVIVTPEGRPKVLDFGLARRVSGGPNEATRSMATVTEPGTVAGTLPFMAPEVLSGETADARSDLWALGVMLYHMLTGAYPFWGATAFDISSAIQRDAPAPLPSHVPAPLATVIRRLLAKQPGERYQRAGEVRAALEAIQSGVMATPPAPGPRAGRRWMAAAAAVVAVAAPVAWWALRARAPAVAVDNSPRLSDGARPSPNADANVYYEQSIQFMTGGPRHEPQRAREMLEKALAADPKFAAARATLAFGQMLLVMQGDTNDASWIYKAEETARQALRDDPDCGTAHSVLAATALTLGRKDRILDEANQAIRANPRDMSAKLWIPIYHRVNGDHERAAAEIQAIIARAPTFWPARLNLAESLIEMGDTAGAIREIQRILDVDPQSRVALASLARAHMETGDLGQARKALERMADSARSSYRVRLHWALLLALEGKRAEARREMDEGLLRYAGIGQYWPLWAAEFHAVMGETDKALEWLDRAARAGDDRENYWRRDPHLASLRGNPRFQQMLDAAAYRRKERAARAK